MIASMRGSARIVTGRGSAGGTRVGKRVWAHVALSVGAWALAMGSGCQRGNPAFGGAADASATDAGDAAGDGASDRSGDTFTDATPDTTPMCVIAADCMVRNGPPVCGAWQCRNGTCAVNCPNCTDGDRDGFGVGGGCAGPDCDDTNPAIHASIRRACYSGPANTAGVGACRSGTETCTDGVWMKCTGQVIPSGEACNAEDDDCNGRADDGLPAFTCGLGVCQNSVASCGAGMLAACVPHGNVVDVDPCGGGDEDCDGQVDEDCPAAIAACIHVSPDGRDDTGNGTVDAPYQTIQAAITHATPTAVAGATSVCVAGGQTCADRTTYMLANGLMFVMANGVSVYGNYESTRWTRCPLDSSAPDPHVTIELREGTGVRFPPTITTPTTLDGFVLTRATANTTAAVTVNGARHVQLSNLVVNDAPQSMRSYGINLNGGEALITHCSIAGGAGTIETIGVRSNGSTVTMRENCSMPDPVTGRCASSCGTTQGLGIRGRMAQTPLGTSTAVLLDASPGAAIETNLLCADQGGQAIGLRVTGDATGTLIRGNTISATTGITDSLGISLEDCNDAAPWIVGNRLIEGQGSTHAVGILSVGTCHPVINDNALITAGGDLTTSEADGVSCESNGGGEPSLCAVLGNERIQGSSNNRPLVAAGVACKEEGCARVAGNLVQGNLGGNVIGVWLRNDGTMVEQNQIVGGCGTQTAAGILADDTFARIQNNLVSGGICPTNDSSTPRTVGVRIYDNDDLNEIDVHSNTIDGGGNSAVSCISVGLEWGVGPETPPSAPKGIVRNNIMRGGACNARSDFAEVHIASDPRLFENNDLDPSSGTLYLDENMTILGTADAVNALTDITARNNLEAAPQFVSFPINQRLQPTSACIGAGTPVGAPAKDFEGKPRSATHPTVGAYE